MRAVEKRSGGWYVVEHDGAFGGYATTSSVARRRKIPVPSNAGRERAVAVARERGMLDGEEQEVR